MKIGFIGAGNMGGALAVAAAKSNNEIVLFDKSNEKAKDIADKCNGFVSDLDTIIKNSDYIFLGVKPQVLPDLLIDIKQVLDSSDNKPVFISMAAGTPIKKIEDVLGNDTPLLRIMPNLPVMYGEGVILLCKNKTATEENIKDFENFMACAGEIIKIEEKFIDAASAISGCGPAFCYMFIEALADGGVSSGLTSELSLKLAAATLKGAATMALESGKHPGKLKADVCSPGGTTIAGVRSLEEHNFRATAMDAVISSYKRTLELAGK